MRHIVVTKFGNEPDIFGTSLRCGMIGDWEVRKLIQVLALDKNNFVTYYGKAKWNDELAKELFVNNNVRFIESSKYDNPYAVSFMSKIDEFHVLLGPHAFYNAGKKMPCWESIKSSIVTERLLERVAPQIKLMNCCDDAKRFFYLSDRRFLLQAADLQKGNNRIYAQTFEEFYYDRHVFHNKDYTNISQEHLKVRPIRFDSLWLLGKSYEEYKKNCENENKLDALIVSANQVTSDEEIENSRLDKLQYYLNGIDNFIVCGKWTHNNAINLFTSRSKLEQYLDGADIEQYNKLLNSVKYAFVTFNTSDSSQCFVDNYLTPKYWECVFNGCITFVEATDYYIKDFPKELQVLTSEELRDKLNKCKNDVKYKLYLKQLQDSLVKREYFSGQYFNDYVNNERSEEWI